MLMAILRIHLLQLPLQMKENQIFLMSKGDNLKRLVNNSLFIYWVKWDAGRCKCLIQYVLGLTYLDDMIFFLVNLLPELLKNICFLKLCFGRNFLVFKLSKHVMYVILVSEPCLNNLRTNQYNYVNERLNCSCKCRIFSRTKMTV